MLAYHRLLTAGRPSRWWVLLGVVMVGVIFLVAQTAAAWPSMPEKAST